MKDKWAILLLMLPIILNLLLPPLTFFLLVQEVLAPYFFNCRWGGPLTQNWLDKQLMLQKKILSRMLELGMTPGMLQLHSHVAFSSFLFSLTYLYPVTVRSYAYTSIIRTEDDSSQFSCIFM